MYNIYQIICFAQFGTFPGYKNLVNLSVMLVKESQKERSRLIDIVVNVDREYVQILGLFTLVFKCLPKYIG